MAGKRRLRKQLEDTLARLAFAEGPTVQQLQALGRMEGGEDFSLFHVSAVKWVKDGMEVKFYDRFHAMELLTQLDAGADTTEGAQAFYRALSNAAPPPLPTPEGAEGI